MIAPKSISNELASLIKKAVESVSDFYDSWAEAVKLGKREGLTVEQLQEIARPLLRVKLSTKQVWYLFHQEEQKERSKQQYGNAKKTQDRTNISTNDDKKALEQSNTVPDDDDVPVTTIDKPIYKDEGRQYEEQYNKEVAKIESIRAMPRPEPEINPLDIVVVGRYGLFEPEKTAQALSKDLSKVNLGRVKKWKVVEISARYVS